MSLEDRANLRDGWMDGWICRNWKWTLTVQLNNELFIDLSALLIHSRGMINHKFAKSLKVQFCGEKKIEQYSTQYKGGMDGYMTY